MNQERSREAAYRFIVDRIDTVPHLEALLLMWRNRPYQWTSEEMAKRLFVSPDYARNICQDLVRQDLIIAIHGENGIDCYEFKTGENENLMKSVDLAYREELVRISTMIHTKAPAAIREFARAFRIMKERE